MLNLIERINDWSGFPFFNADVKPTIQEEGVQLPVASHKLQPVVPIRGDAYDKYSIARNNGHHLTAHNQLRRFFDYRFGSGAADRLHHHHALHNLATLYYDQKGYLQARVCLTEAIRIARQAGDRDCLAGCYSLAKRLDYHAPLHRSVAGAAADIAPATSAPTANDQLWLVKQGLHAVRRGC